MPMVCIYVPVVKVRFQKRRIIFMSYILQWVIVQEVEGVEFMHLCWKILIIRNILVRI